MKNASSIAILCALLAVLPQTAPAWVSYLDGTSLPQANGWILDGDTGTLLDLGGGNSGFRQVDDTSDGYDEWYMVNTNATSTLAARFRIDTYGGGPINLLQLTAANAAGTPSPALAVTIRDGRFYLIRFIADNTGAAVEDARLADLAPVEPSVFNEAHLHIDSNTGRVRLFWNGALRYSGVETNAAYMWAGEAYAEFGASNFLPEADRSGLCTVTFDWVGLGDAGDLPLALPFIPWAQYVDGSALPGGGWQSYSEPDAGVPVVSDFIDPANGALNQAVQVSSGSGLSQWYVGPLGEDEVFGGARFRVESFSPTGKENLMAMVTVSEPLSPAPSITLVDGRFKLWSYVHESEPFGAYPGFEIADIAPVVAGEWHTAYLYAKKDGRVRLWWDGQLLFDDTAPLVNPFDGYFEWGSGSWQHDATDIVAFDWIAYGALSAQPTLTTMPANGAIFHNFSAGFSFTNISSDGVAADGVTITVNGVDRTSALIITGTDNNRQGTLSGLLSNQLYEVVLSVTELDGDAFTFTIRFDTFSQDNLIFEAEDWNFDGGRFFDNPLLSSDPYDDTYYGKSSVQEVDYHDRNTLPGASHQYRDLDPVGTEITGDILRQKFIDAQQTDPAVTDYNVGWVEVGEWLNYSRTFPAGEYNIYGRFAYGVPGGLFRASVEKVQDATVQDQTLAPVGVFLGGPGRGWQDYDFVPLTDLQGNLLTVSLDGVQTLRVTATEGGYNVNFYMLVPAQRPLLNIEPSNGSAIISWLGEGFVLQSAPALTGPWEPVPNQSNPFTAPTTDPARFFRLVSSSRPPIDAVVSFNDLADGPISGVYAGLDWGAALWAVGGAWEGITSQNVYLNSGNGDPATGRISATSGAFLLKSLRTTSDTAGTITLTDNNGQTASLTLTPGTPATLTTGWTAPSQWVDVTSSLGWGIVFDDFTYAP
jgi:hypothetical protein